MTHSYRPPFADGDSTSVPEGNERAAPIRLAAGPHLFVDDHLIERRDGLTWAINHPERLPLPVLTAREDRNFQPYVTVLRDADRGRFRAWYNARDESGKHRVAYIESEDGIRWLRPHRALGSVGEVGFGASVVDDGPACSDPRRRYKLAWWMDGLRIAHSPDGLRWRPVRAVPVLPAASDIVSLMREPGAERYLATFKLESVPEDGFPGAAPKGPGERPVEGYRRLVGQSQSDDLARWAAPRRIFVPDARDEGITEFYSVGGVVSRGGLLIGMLRVLRDDLAAEPGGPAEGIGYTVLAWSRDGVRWSRDREPFLDRNPRPGSWDRAMSWIDSQLPVGDEVYLYYGGYERGHKVGRFRERQIGLARLPRDRYVSLDAGRRPGYLRTPLVVLDAARMTANGKVGGELRMRVSDPSGRAVPGFDWADCFVPRGDSVSEPLRCRESLASLRGRPVRLEFRLREARLYGFVLAG